MVPPYMVTSYCAYNQTQTVLEWASSDVVVNWPLDMQLTEFLCASLCNCTFLCFCSCSPAGVRGCT